MTWLGEEREDGEHDIINAGRSRHSPGAANLRVEVDDLSVAGGRPEEDTYTTGQVARILRITDRGVRKMIDRGELEARQSERGRHLIPQRAVHALLEDRRASGVPPAAEISGQDTARSAEEARELRERVEGLQRELGRLEGRLELTERTESSMREERERLARLLDEERAERQRLQEELDAERGKGFWRRLFGG